jgi:PAS domain S-box-containing protein
MDLIPDPVIVVDCRRHINLWNRAAVQTYGFTRAEAIGRLTPELLCTRFPIPLQEILELVGDTGGWCGRLVQRAKDGHELTVDSRWITLSDARGDVSGGLEIDRELAVDVKQESLGARSQWPVGRRRVPERSASPPGPERPARVAHDLNNLLAVIIGSSAVLAGELEAIERESDEPRCSSMREAVREVQLAAERATRLTRRLLAFSRR